MKRFAATFLVATAGALMGAGIVSVFNKSNQFTTVTTAPGVQLTSLRSSSGAVLVEKPDFIQASAAATPAVVHIKSYFEGDQNAQANDFFREFFGQPGGSPFGQASGSGVIISADGYIATNNHVIKDADKVEVVLNDKRSYIAQVIGTDPTTDLAMLKIEESNLPFLNYGNSDNVQVGEWVLAVGNPFNLTSTVTAGIVSAKGRNLNLLQQEFAIESFIQTDAAVNPGNSGGALINTQGELVGINTAIASETGSYQGYSFAVPVNIVRKVMKDLQEFGEVQRGIIGVQITNLTAAMAKEKGISTLDGAYVNGIIDGSAAADAGIRTGDLITRVNGTAIRSSAQLQEVIGTFRPGDKVSVRVLRSEEEREFELTLRDRKGNTSVSVSDEAEDSEPATAVDALGAQLEALRWDEKKTLNLSNGVRVSKAGKGKLSEVGIEDGFIITRVNKEYVNTPEEVTGLLSKADGSILIEGLNREGKKQFFAFE